jgi:multisubunit Na+/H+ antiporter MnhB subunit
VVLLVIGIDELARKRYRRALVWISLGLFFAALSMALLMSWNRAMLRVWEMHNTDPT